MLKLALLLAAALIATPVSADAGDEAADIFLRSQGLGDLTPEQQIAARRVVKGLAAGSSSSSTLSGSADAYFRAQGYRPIYLRIVKVEEQSYLIAADGVYSHATADLPVTFVPWLFKDGEYYSKPNFSGGISEFIDDRGRQQSMIFAKWVQLRR